jgi:hypothetical protein
VDFKTGVFVVHGLRRSKVYLFCSNAGAMTVIETLITCMERWYLQEVSDTT